jgi:hypothetical protein
LKTGEESKNMEMWEDLPTSEHRVLLRNLDDIALSKRFKRQEQFFSAARSFFESLPPNTTDPQRQMHSPPKDLVLSARRDLSFFEANYELVDNSVDEWRKRGELSDLHIHIVYDLDQLTGKYVDDAGGMRKEDVFKVFIPGETTNRKFNQNVIGSFGLGAKKGIFRLTDGAKIISCPQGDHSYTSEVPERWELDSRWETEDGEAEAIGKGQTHLYFFKLVNPPTLADIDDLRNRLTVIYAPLLTARLGSFGDGPKSRVHITVNGVAVTGPKPINWSCPKGAEPRAYRFSHTFKNFLSTGEDIELRFVFVCGVTRYQPGAGVDREHDFGVDVYGNGRLIERHLKEPFGWGIEKGLKKNDSASKFVRGELFINGHSFAIPWDTHKREYMGDHLVAQWLRAYIPTIIKSYRKVANRFTSNTEARKTILATAKPEEGFVPPVFDLEADYTPPIGSLPSVKSLPSAKAKKKSAQATTEEQSETGSESTEEDNGTEPADSERTITVTLDAPDYDELMDRFAANSPEDLDGAVRDCLIGGVAFVLTPEQLALALETFKCDGDIGQLSNIVRSQLLKKIGH